MGDDLEASARQVGGDLLKTTGRRMGNKRETNGEGEASGRQAGDKGLEVRAGRWVGRKSGHSRVMVSWLDKLIRNGSY